MNQEEKFLRKLNKRFAKVQPTLQRVSGVMGDASGNLYVPGRPNYIYVRVNDKAFSVYYNPNRVVPKVGVKVWLGYSSDEPTLYQLLSTRSDTPDDVTHLERLRDSRFFSIRDLTFLRIGMSSLGGSYIDLQKGRIWSGTELIAVPQQQVDLSAHVPEVFGRAAFVLITIDTIGAAVQTKGDEVQLHELEDIHIPDPPAGTAYVSGAVRVYYGQERILEAQTNTDFVDLRLVNYRMADIPAVDWGDITNIPDAFPPDLTVTDALYPRKWYESGDPTPSDDTTLGYSKLDLWLNQSSDLWFVLLDDAEDAAIWVEIGSGGGSTFGDLGHVIEDDGTPMTQRESLNFVGFTVTDDAGSDATVVTAPAGTALDYDQLHADIG